MAAALSELVPTWKGGARWGGGQRWFHFVDGGIVEPGGEEGLSALDAGAAGAAVEDVAFVAGPGLAVVDAEVVAELAG